ncbi:MAG TPA: type IV pilus assembly protein PilM [Nitrospiria bacterium]|nr:type IV pilus assembly protein PilM [Nitrospiria bacterium]
MLFHRAQPVIGLDIGSNAIKLLQLKSTKKGYVVEKFGIKTIDPELIVDGAVMDAGRVVDILKELLREQTVKAKDVVISVSGHSVIVKKISVPPMTEEELDESIKWEAEQYIPFDVNDVNLDFHILPSSDVPEGKEAMTVVLAAVKKDRLSEYTALVSEAGLNPVVVDVDAFTLENVYDLAYGSTGSEVVALVNIGASVMNIHIVKGGNFSFTRDISTGGNRYTETIQRDLNVSYEAAERAKRGENVEGVNPNALAEVINTMNGELAAEIGRSFDYFRSTSTQETIDRVLLSGGTAKLAGLVPFLSERLGVPVELLDPFRNIRVNPKTVSPDLIAEVGPQATVVVGLATRRPDDR